MTLYENPRYMEDLGYVAGLKLPWRKIDGNTVVISGGTGMIGSFLVDVLLYRNEHFDSKTTVIILGRDKQKAEKRFSLWWSSPWLHFMCHDITKPLTVAQIGRGDYVFHLASNTHPLAYATDPIGTITTNVLGTMQMLNYAVESGATRAAIASSNEIYGENRGDVEFFDELYDGYIDCNTMRAGYPESKRCAEALCQAYIKQKGIDIVIPRFTRTYGPTMLQSDTKAISQFLKKGISGENIVLKSAGNQYYSYTYVADAVSGFMTAILSGECGKAYNIADQRSDIELKNLAAIIANYSSKQVVFELPDSVEESGYSTATKARLSSIRLEKLGWHAKYDIRSGINQTMDIIKSITD